MSDVHRWLPTGVASAAVHPDTPVAARAGGWQIILYSVDDQIYATDEFCTHGQASLADGYLEGHSIECPLHQGRFDVRTGAAIAPPCTDPIRCFPAKVEDGQILVEVPAG